MTNCNPTTEEFNRIRKEWHERAPALADWVWARLVNRRDVYGQYLSLDQRRGAEKCATNYTLNLRILRDHFAYENEGDLIGLHTTSPSNTSRWLAIDIDKHDSDDADPEVNLQAALSWFAVLDRLDHEPILTDSNGRGGYHLIVIFEDPRPTAEVFALGRWLTANFKHLGLRKQPETFPKQAQLADKKIGNWLRLPGKHHTLEHFTRVWNGSNWLCGTGAIDYLLKHRGSGTPISDGTVMNVESKPQTTSEVDPIPRAKKLARATVTYKENGAPNGERNSELFKAAVDMAGNGVDAAEITSQLEPAALKSGLTPEETSRTIKSATSRPRTPAIPAETLRREREPFPVGVLPEVLREYVRQGAEAHGCDVAALIGSILTTLAGCAGNTRIIQIKLNWSEPLPVWFGLIGNSGAKKSPAIDLAVKPLYSHQEDALREFQAAKVVHEAAVADFEARLRKWKKEKSARPEPPRAPISRRTLLNDITMEALKLRLMENPRGVLVVWDELSGLFGSVDAYRRGRGSDLAHYLTMFGARPLIDDRKSSGPGTILVPRSAVSILGGIQPAVLRRTLGRKLFENGLAARFLFVWADARWDHWTDKSISNEASNAYANLVHEFLALEFGKDWDGSVIPVEYQFTAKAQNLWIEFYNAHADELNSIGDPDLQAAGAKLLSYAARIAVLLYLARDIRSEGAILGGPHVDEVSLGSAIAIVRWFANETKRIYQMLGESNRDSQERHLTDYIKQRGGVITVRDMQRASMKGLKSVTAVVAAFDHLVASGLALWIPSGVALAERNGADSIKLIGHPTPDKNASDS